MIFDSLNPNKNEFLNVTVNSKQDATTPSNQGLTDYLTKDITKNELAIDTKENLNLSFNQYLNAVTDTNGIQPKNNLADEQSIDGNLIPLIEDVTTLNEEIVLSEIKDTVIIDTEIKLTTELIANAETLSLDASRENDVNNPINAKADNELTLLSNEVSVLVDRKFVLASEIPRLINDQQRSVNATPGLINELQTLSSDKPKNNFLSSEKLVNLDSSRLTMQVALDSKVALNDKVSVANELTLESKLNQNVQEKLSIDKETAFILNRNTVIEGNSLPIKEKSNLENVKLSDNTSFVVNLTNVSKSLKPNLENVSIDKPGAVELLKTDVIENNLLTQFNTLIKPVTEQSLLPESIVLKQPLNTNGQFSNSLGIRIQWMLQQALSSAEIMLDPPELGPMNVKLVQAGSEMNIIFQVQTAQGKDAIEANLAKLKEMLLAQGITLGETEIQQKQKQKDEDDDKQQSFANNGEDSELKDGIDSGSPQITQSNVALLDTYI